MFNLLPGSLSTRNHNMRTFVLQGVHHPIFKLQTDLPNMPSADIYLGALPKGKHCLKVVDRDEIPSFVEKTGIIVGGG